MKMEIKNGMQTKKQNDPIHDILHREQTAEEKSAFEVRVKAIFERYDPAFRNLAK